jgi:hypothetical protein
MLNIILYIFGNAVLIVISLILCYGLLIVIKTKRKVIQVEIQIGWEKVEAENR